MKIILSLVVGLWFTSSMAMQQSKEQEDLKKLLQGQNEKTTQHDTFPKMNKKKNTTRGEKANQKRSANYACQQPVKRKNH
jgi:hypothetical protein